MIKKIINFILLIFSRHSSFEAKIFAGGIALIGSSPLVPVIKLLFPRSIPFFNEIEIEYGVSITAHFYLGVFLIFISLAFYIRKEIIFSKKMKLGLYQQYLMNPLEQDFSLVINKKSKSLVTITKTDITNLVSNNILESPENALIEVNDGINTFLKNIKSHNNDVILYYGGLIAVPFSFYTGMEVDDRYPITVFDYDRNDEKWKEIKEMINPEFSPNISIENNGNNSGNSIISIGVSYPINEDEIQSNFPNYPISKIAIDPININNHWDLMFQKELQSKFFELAQKLGVSGTKTIHLILAAQNSVSFNLGRCYDNRNLPEIIVYQYEKGNEIRYPWGIKMKTSGVQEAEIITVSTH